MKIITYNIDGLPESLDLRDLPWIFKPIVWIYKLIKKTTNIYINKDSNRKESILQISKYLLDSEADIIGVQEDFNFHDELISSLNTYSCGTYLGKFDPSKIFQKTEWWSHFPFPRYKIDGLNILIKNNISFIEEKIVKWKKGYGYFKYYNDLLAHKGFRFYSTSNNIDFYILHMDAGSKEKDILSRKEQIKQLTNFILDRYNLGYSNPIIIMGDTNCYKEEDIININEYLYKPINDIQYLYINQVIPNNGNKIDKIFYINNIKSKQIVFTDCYFDYNNKLSDHVPLIANFKLI